MQRIPKLTDDQAIEIYNQVHSLHERPPDFMHFLETTKTKFYAMKKAVDIHPADFDLAVEAYAKANWHSIKSVHFAQFRHWRRMWIKEHDGKIPEKSDFGL